MAEIKKEATAEQLLYAKILEKGMYLGLVLMFITFALYVFGIMKPVVPLEQISNYWNLPVDQYLAAINQNFLHQAHPPVGWAWMGLLGNGDFLNFLPVALLAAVTIVCYLSIVPGLFARGDKAMGLITLATAIVLILAASGMLGSGGH